MNPYSVAQHVGRLRRMARRLDDKKLIEEQLAAETLCCAALAIPDDEWRAIIHDTEETTVRHNLDTIQRARLHLMDSDLNRRLAKSILCQAAQAIPDEAWGAIQTSLERLAAHDDAVTAARSGAGLV